MKIDSMVNKFIDSLVPDKETKKSDTSSPLNVIPNLVKDVMEQFNPASADKNQLLQPSSKNVEGDRPQSKRESETLERNMLKARVGGRKGENEGVQKKKGEASGASKSGDEGVQKNGELTVEGRKGEDEGVEKKKDEKGDKKAKGGGFGSKIFEDKNRIVVATDVNQGAGYQSDKISNISGIINWDKGYTIADGEFTLFRPLEFDKKITNEKIGEASAIGKFDILNMRGRIFGQADFSLKKSLFELGIGAQGAFELLAGHFKLEHIAPDVTLAGINASLRTVINGDAYIGAIAEGGAQLSLSWDNFFEKSFLELGGQAFAGAAASISGSMSLGKLMNLRGSAEAYAGVGGKALVNIGFEKGELNVDTGFGGAMAIGAGYDVGFSLNFLEIGKLGENIGNNFLSNPVSYPVDFLHNVGSVLGVNLGSGLGLLDEAFHLTSKSGNVPSESTRETQTVEERLEEKRNRTPAQPVA